MRRAGGLVAATSVVLGSACGTVAAAASTIGELKQLNVEDLLNIEVTSVTRRPEPLLGAAAAIQVITGEEIRRSGAVSLPEALRLADNLQVAQRGSRGWAISARGFNTELANKLLVMIDGRTVYTPLFSGVFWEAQGYLLEDIERIEVVSGPGGTLWGANAVNGVISVMTRSAADTHGLYLEGGAGDELQAAASLRYGAEVAPDMHLRVFATHAGHDEAVLADGAPAGDAGQRTQAGFRLDMLHAAGGELTLQGDFHNNEADDREAGGTTINRGANLLGRWNRQLGESSDLSLQAYVDWARFADPLPPFVLGTIPLSPAGRFEDDLYTFDLDFQHRLQAAGAHDITWGLGFRHTRDRASNGPGLAFLPASLDQNLYSVFVQDEIHLREDLSVTAGTKVEHNDYTGFEFEPSVRMQWQVAAAQSVWAAVSRAIRAPSRVDRDVFRPAPPNPGVLYGNPEFRSEKLLAWELGHRGTYGARLATAAAFFYNKYDDLRSTSITADTLIPFFFENNLVGHTYGMELTGDLQVTDRWRMRMGYMLLEERLRVREGHIDISNARNETADPEQQVSLRASLTLPRGWEIDSSLRWVDILRNNNGPDPGSVPHYIELDARIGWQLSPHLSVSLVGRNLLHGRHPEYGFPGPARIEAQRSVHGKLVWRP